MYSYLFQDIFLGEILGAVVIGGADHSDLELRFGKESVQIHANGNETEDGKISVNEEQKGRSVRVLKNVSSQAFHDRFADQLGKEKQSAVIGSFEEQKRIWSTPNKSDSIRNP